MKKLVIFDLDGTLLNSLGDLNYCMNYILKTNGYNCISMQQTIKYIGYGAKKYLELSLADKCDKEAVDKLLPQYSDFLAMHSGERSYLYDGISELLKQLKLKNIKLAVVSNKPQDSAEAVRDLFLKEYGFDEIVGVRKDFPVKPDPFAVEYVLNKLNVNKQDAIYVGDSEVDVKTAKNAKIDGVYCLWGFRTKEELQKEGGTNFINKPSELLNYIE